MELEFELRDYSKVPASTANRPEQVLILICADVQLSSIGQHHVGGNQIIDGHAVFTREPSETASQRETGHSRGGINPCGCGQAICLHGPVEIRKSITRLNVSAPFL